MYIEQDPVPVIEGFGAQHGLVLAAGSRIMLQAGTELDVQEATNVAGGVAFTKQTRVRLLDPISARLKGPLQVIYEDAGVAAGADLVEFTTNDAASIELDAGVRVAVVETGDTITAARAGEALLPAGSKVRQAGAIPLPDGGETTGRVLSQEQMNLIWAGRTAAAGAVAALAATAGTVTTFVLAARGQKRGAWIAGVVGLVATAAGVGAAVFASRRVVRTRT